MEVTINTTPTKATITLNGRLDTMAATKVGEQLEPAMAYTDKEIEMDCAQMDFISSSGLRIVLSLQKKVMADGGKLVLTHVCPEVQNVFKLTGFNRLVTIQD